MRPALASAPLFRASAPRLSTFGGLFRRSAPRLDEPWEGEEEIKGWKPGGRFRNLGFEWRADRLERRDLAFEARVDVARDFLLGDARGSGGQGVRRRLRHGLGAGVGSGGAQHGGILGNAYSRLGGLQGAKAIKVGPNKSSTAEKAYGFDRTDAQASWHYSPDGASSGGTDGSASRRANGGAGWAMPHYGPGEYTPADEVTTDESGDIRLTGDEDWRAVWKALQDDKKLSKTDQILVENPELDLAPSDADAAAAVHDEEGMDAFVAKAAADSEYRQRKLQELVDGPSKYSSHPTAAAPDASAREDGGRSRKKPTAQTNSLLRSRAQRRTARMLQDTLPSLYTQRGRRLVRWHRDWKLKHIIGLPQKDKRWHNFGRI